MRSSTILSSSLLIAGQTVTLVKAYTVVNSKNFMFKNIDPIVFPGSFTKSHFHIFFGSDGVKASTTTSADLRAGCTTADNPNDMSTYWTPTLLFTGNGTESVPIAPGRFSAYYENIDAADSAFPENLQLFAGNPKATQQSEMPEGAKISWFCEGDEAPADKLAGAFPETTCSTHLQHLVHFPDCVSKTDPKYTTASYNTPSNNLGNRCPDGFSRIPRLRFSIRYDLRKIIPDGWNGPPPLTLSSGNSFSAHGDFFNGWDTEAATNMLQALGREFMLIGGSKGKGDAKPTCVATDAEPNQGTSDFATSVKTLAGRRSIPFSG